ncbi:hypothetical protein AJ79_05729 [Helicocarpus griseus UAMH5409]|uniref:AA9 family lytic polysaccharide monooxygenase n=1 Tax=Helicocarpus griseus UAMH5409 TaxID=1447875 RepID=A0A2B7XJW0_9EURO|nr:hypothetical protein AJ79_05729 [Helicocarpus griseus UAMH5409]
MIFTPAALPLLVSTLLPLASGHYVFSKMIVDGDATKDFEYIRQNTNGYMPTLLSEITADSFRCNQGSDASAAKTGVYTVSPGAEIGFQLAYGATMKHPGPLQIYMSKAPGSVTAYDGSGDWFKVYEMGLCKDISGGLADTDWCTWDKDTVSFTLPADTPPGEYLVRVEHIGLHRAFSGNTEFYFTCGQIKVTGSGSGSPGPMVSIPGVYQQTDENVNLNIYYPKPTSYSLPGPAVWKGGSSGSSAGKPLASADDSTAAAPVASKPKPPVTTTLVKLPGPAPSDIASGHERQGACHAH